MASLVMWLGVSREDLVKPEKDLVLAYDDPLGVTAAFNKNLLARANTELSADFDLAGFEKQFGLQARRLDCPLIFHRVSKGKAGQPIATAAKVPFIGPFTGAEFLRNPFNRYVVNIRASYFQETEAWVEHLTRDLGVTRIAILYQDDAFGLAGAGSCSWAANFQSAWKIV